MHLGAYYFKINLITDIVGDMTKTEAPKQKVSEAEKQTMTGLIDDKISYLNQKKAAENLFQNICIFFKNTY
jgi:hypothetical protein